MSSAPTRRQVLQVAAGGALAAGVATVTAGVTGRAEQAAVASTPGTLDLYVNEGFVPMVDGSLVYMRGYGDAPTDISAADPSLTISPRVFLANGELVESRTYPLDAEVPDEGRPEPAAPHPDRVREFVVHRAHWASFFPRRTIIAETGSTIRLAVHNRLGDTHRFWIPGVVDSGPIAPGATASLDFAAPAAGTYIYCDNTNAPVQRVLGLHGVLVVVPAEDRWRLSPGGAEFERQWVWLCHDVDPVWAARTQRGEVVDPVATPAVPRYFMLNDRSGYLSLAVSTDLANNLAAHEETLVAGFPRPTDVRDFSTVDAAGSVVTGQMIRLVNLGVVVHQMHFHGNHVWTLRRNGNDFPRSEGRVDADGHVVLQQWEDVVELDPLDRKEIILPIKRPPDVIDPVWENRSEDWHYPMHCHAEPSQTAAGGLYPGGLVADWILAFESEEGTQA